MLLAQSFRSVEALAKTFGVNLDATASPAVSRKGLANSPLRLNPSPAKAVGGGEISNHSSSAVPLTATGDEVVFGYKGFCELVFDHRGELQALVNVALDLYGRVRDSRRKVSKGEKEVCCFLFVALDSPCSLRCRLILCSNPNTNDRPFKITAVVDKVALSFLDASSRAILRRYQIDTLEHVATSPAGNFALIMQREESGKYFCHVFTCGSEADVSS